MKEKCNLTNVRKLFFIVSKTLAVSIIIYPHISFILEFRCCWCNFLYQFAISIHRLCEVKLVCHTYVGTNTKAIKVLALFLHFAFALAFVTGLICSFGCSCCWPYAFSFPFIKICATCGKRACKLRQPNKCVRWEWREREMRMCCAKQREKESERGSAGGESTCKRERELSNWNFSYQHCNALLLHSLCLLRLPGNSS